MSMVKLYKQTDRGLLYHEAWPTNDGIVEHWGAVGEAGNTKTHPLPRSGNSESAIEAVLADARSTGFVEIDEEDQIILLIEYAIDGMGTPHDLDKRHALQERMNGMLGWTGLGDCDGGSTGSNTMEVCCFVVDFEIACRAIQADLADTEFADYVRIFDQSAG